jgi:hypothetical protein
MVCRDESNIGISYGVRAKPEIHSFHNHAQMMSTHKLSQLLSNSLTDQVVTQRRRWLN